MTFHFGEFSPGNKAPASPQEEEPSNTKCMFQFGAVCPQVPTTEIQERTCWRLGFAVDDVDAVESDVGMMSRDRECTVRGDPREIDDNLWETGVSIAAKNTRGSTPLRVAAREGNTQLWKPVCCSMMELA